MTITLGAIELSDNMYLEGVEKAKQLEYNQVRTVEGLPYLTSVSTPGGRIFTLGTTSVRGTTQGIWCKETIDAIKSVEASLATVTLEYFDNTYVVQIVDTTDFKQLFQFEPVGPYKKFTGKITLIEV